MTAKLDTMSGRGGRPADNVWQFFAQLKKTIIMIVKK